jgi:hypothetical protein
MSARYAVAAGMICTQCIAAAIVMHDRIGDAVTTILAIF